jgi:hypothetical protein
MTNSKWTIFLRKYNKLDDLIKINWNISTNSVVFLDLIIYFNNNSIHTKIYQKPTNIYQYIPPTSFHKHNQLHNFIGAELERFYFLSSTYKEYVETSQLFWDRLIKQGYSHSILHKIFSKFNNINLPTKWNTTIKPPSTLQPKQQQPHCFFLKLPYNPTFKHFKLSNLLPNTSNLPETFQNFMISWYNHPTIGKKLIKAQFGDNDITENINNNNIELSLEFSEDNEDDSNPPQHLPFWDILKIMDEDIPPSIINNNSIFDIIYNNMSNNLTTL